MLIINNHLADSTINCPLHFDDGFTFGRGAFETLPVYDHPLWLEAHLKRLNQTLPLLGIARQISAEQILELIQRFEIRQQALKIVVTPENLLLVTRPLPAHDPEGIRLYIHPDGHPQNAPMAGLKTLNYLGYQLAREEALAQEYQDALLVSGQNMALETTTANLFVVQGDIVRTPLQNGTILPGIVRAFVLGLDPQLVRVEEGSLPLADVLAADAVFVTNSLVGILPVVEISGTGHRRLFPQTAVNPRLLSIQSAYQSARRSHNHA